LGKIIKVVAKEKQQSDSIFTSVIYDDFYANTLLYTLSNFKVQGTTVRDSVVFVYDGNGHIGIQKTYRQKPNSSYRLYQQQEYAYAANNLIKARQFVDSSNTAILVLAAEYHYTYDTRINPLQLHNEAVLTGSPEKASLNNLIAIDLDNKMFPSDNYKVESKLLYSNTRKPVYCTSVKSPVGTISVVTYYYK
jgi:lipopolysaccharide export LptBFGC system permease protein LptF